MPPAEGSLRLVASNLVALLRMNLFTHRDLWTWLDRPFEGPTLLVAAQQVELALA